MAAWGKSSLRAVCRRVPVQASPMCDSGKVDGMEWWTTPDQLASAADIAKKIKADNNIEVWGDSLALAMSRHTNEFIDEIISFE